MNLISNIIVVCFMIFLISSCASETKSPKETYRDKIKKCMKEFADEGYSSKGVILICKAIYKERK